MEWPSTSDEKQLGFATVVKVVYGVTMKLRGTSAVNTARTCESLATLFYSELSAPH